jgi:hypothetical protein
MALATSICFSEQKQDNKTSECQDSFAFSYPRKSEVSCSKDSEFYAEFLYFNSHQSFEYADETDPEKTRTKSNYYKPGFRLGMNTLFRDDWVVDIDWTYMKLKADSNITSNDDSVIGALLPPDAFDNIMNTASARRSGDFNTLDVNLIKPYRISRYFVSKPMFGLRGAWIDQDFHARYFISNVKNNVTIKNDCWGIGLRGAYEAQILLGKGWFFYGKTAFSLLYGKIDVSQNSTNIIDTLEYQTKNSFNNILPNAECALGFCYSRFFDDHKYLLTFKAAYEFHYWWNQANIRKFYDLNPAANDVISDSDLSFNGFMLGLNIEF